MTPEDLGRDAHLLAALRHAPDRDALPPPEVSAAILAQARAAARQAASSRRADAPRWRLALERWVGRPHFAAALGSVAVAALVGVMWSAHEPPLPTDSVPAPAASLPPDTAVREPESTTPVPPPSTDSAGPAAPAPARPTAKRREGAAKAAVDPTAPTPPAPAADRRALADEVGSTTSRAASTPAPQLLPRTPNDQRARQEGVAAALAPAARIADPLSSLDKLMQGAAADLAWRAANVTRPHGEAQRRWWASVRAATQGRWQAHAAAPDLPAPWLELAAGERVWARLWIEDGALWLREGDRLWQAPVADALLREWQGIVGGW